MTDQTAPVEETASVDGVKRDIAVVAFCGVLLYGATMLSGPGWGTEAALQATCSPGGSGSGIAFSPLFTIPARVFAALVPASSYAFAVNLFCALLAVATLAVVHLSLRLCNIPSRTALLAVGALALSQAFYGHAARPNVAALSIFFLALELHLLLRFLLFRRRIALFGAVLALLAAAIVQPASALAAVLPALCPGTDLVASRRWIFRAWILLLVVVECAVAGFGLHAAWLPIGFTLLQFPVVGWLLIVWGARRMRKKMHQIFEIMTTLLVASVPILGGIIAVRAGSPALRDVFDALLPGSLAATFFLAFGIDYLYELRAMRKERVFFVTPVLAIALAGLPIATTGIAAYIARTTGWETELASSMHERIRLYSTPWKNALWYALWPAKSGEGAATFLRDCATLPPDAVLVVDGELFMPLDYARRVEGGFRDLVVTRGLSDHDPVGYALALSAPRADRPRRRVFLAGTDPEVFHVVELGERGELEPEGPFIAWMPAESSDSVPIQR